MFTITVRLYGSWSRRKRIREMLNAANTQHGLCVFYTERWGLFSSTFIVIGVPAAVQHVIGEVIRE